MTPEMVIDIFSQAIYLILFFLAVIILPGLFVGLLISLFQAATQINESSLSFVPKLVATFFVLIFAAPMLLNTLLVYTQDLITQIPKLIG